MERYNEERVRGEPKLREWLTKHGWTVCENGRWTIYKENECNWYAARRSAHKAAVCETNSGKSGIQIVVYPYRWRMPDGHLYRSSEVELCGEAGGLWYTLKAYSIPIDDLRAHLDKAELSLVNAWNALTR